MRAANERTVQRLMRACVKRVPSEDMLVRTSSKSDVIAEETKFGLGNFWSAQMRLDSDRLHWATCDGIDVGMICTIEATTVDWYVVKAIRNEVPLLFYSGMSENAAVRALRAALRHAGFLARR